MKTIVAFVRLGRPLFLGGGFILYALGAAIAAWHGHPIDATRYLVGQAAMTAIQLMTHYSNDYFDDAADRANLTPTRWSGGSRVLVEGALPRVVALVAALVLAAIGLVLAAVATRYGVRPVVSILAALVLAWEYSAPPLRLCASGAGELVTAIVVTGIVPWLGFELQAPELVGLRTLLVAIAPLALLQVAMLLAIEFPDRAGDAATGKRTLVVRLGPERAARLYAAVTALAVLSLPLMALLGLPPRVALAAAIPAPVALWRVVRVGDHRDPAAYERMTFFAVFLLVATAAAELAAFLV